ncbi:enoyl-CoA hydratase-related protein [Solwaraspora sp. WMMD1047]|uniref:enoyl-CoA hydratase/isomerase family protein n=1 Tax=Solwaraspora sp. WMMD1047 TaxID=3016102 RepID=UPI002415A593|nr:enoyl-CoA hydratase-related protein [Solwaraspora sp. WMMD1047]MDG4834334.1 enoyl-CoA hydratase-related protein [Solwaraspora sp. WMMD1047]
MDYPDITFDIHGPVATIAFNRPDRMNSFSPDLLDSAMRAVDVVRRDPDLRVLVLTGTGRAFCAGADTKRIHEERASGQRDSLGFAQVQMAQNLLLALHRLPKPVLGAINGVAAGAGFELSLACDLRIAAESAFFKEAAMGVGLVPGDGSAWFLPRLVGLARAFELFFLEERIPADRALSMGLVNRVVPDEEFPAAVEELARTLASKPPIALALTKQAVVNGLSCSLPETLVELRDSVVTTLATADYVTGSNAVRDRKAPAFEGR